MEARNRNDEGYNEVNLSVSSKEKLRREVEQQVADFLKRGGKIQVLEGHVKSTASNSFNSVDDDSDD